MPTALTAEERTEFYVKIKSQLATAQLATRAYSEVTRHLEAVLDNVVELQRHMDDPDGAAHDVDAELVAEVRDAVTNMLGTVADVSAHAYRAEEQLGSLFQRVLTGSVKHPQAIHDVAVDALKALSTGQLNAERPLRNDLSTPWDALFDAAHAATEVSPHVVSVVEDGTFHLDKMRVVLYAIPEVLGTLDWDFPQ